MEPEMNQGGGDVFDAIGVELQQLIDILGPDEVVGMLQELNALAEQQMGQQGGMPPQGQQMPPQGQMPGPPPQMRPQGGPPPMPGGGGRRLPPGPQRMT